MEKSVNLTLRISPELKAEAEEACKYLDRTVSDVIRAALRSVVKQYQTERAQETRVAREFAQGEHAQVAYDALVREINAKGGAVDVVQGNGISVLKSSANPLPVKQAPSSVHGTSQEVPCPHLDASGDIDLSTMPRKLRRQYERDKAKGRV